MHEDVRVETYVMEAADHVGTDPRLFIDSPYACPLLSPKSIRAVAMETEPLEPTNHEHSIAKLAVALRVGADGASTHLLERHDDSEAGNVRTGDDLTIVIGGLPRQRATGWPNTTIDLRGGITTTLVGYREPIVGMGSDR